MSADFVSLVIVSVSVLKVNKPDKVLAVILLVGFCFIIYILYFPSILRCLCVMEFTSREYRDIHFMYGSAHGNAAEARRMYAASFPNRRLPDDKVFTRVHNRLGEVNLFAGNKRNAGRPRMVRNVAFEEEVLQIFDINARTSTRAVANQLNSSASSVWRVLNAEGLHPFHLQKVHSLLPEDHEPRVNCARWFLQKDIVQPNFLENVLFTDESSFTREGIFNSRNTHVWALLNPHEITVRGYQHRFSVNIWAGILGDRVIGPYVLPNRLNSPTYVSFIRDILPELLEDVPLEIRDNIWFQHDGAPPHFGNVVRDFLDVTYRQQWIGRGGPVPWPARSPDLNPLDFFFWSRIKDLVYSTPVENEEDLVARVVAAAGAIQDDEDVFRAVRESMIRRCRLCNRVEGRHFEQLLH